MGRLRYLIFAALSAALCCPATAFTFTGIEGDTIDPVSYTHLTLPTKA